MVKSDGKRNMAAYKKRKKERYALETAAILGSLVFFPAVGRAIDNSEILFAFAFSFAGMITLATHFA